MSFGICLDAYEKLTDNNVAVASLNLLQSSSAETCDVQSYWKHSLQLKSNQLSANEAGSGERKICHFDFSLARRCVICIFSSMHISALYFASTDTLTCSYSQEFLLCVCVHAGGRSWLKFINLTNEAPCAFFLLTNGTDREVGGGCCLATAGRISDHVGPIVLAPLPERRYMLYVVRNNGV